MSSDPAVAELIAQYDSLRFSLYCSYATFTYISYDWVLTLGDEIELFWKRKLTAASVLYFNIRYLVIIFWIMGYPTTDLHGASCQAYMYTIFALQLLIYIFPAAFSALRVYALTGKNLLLSLIVLFLALGPVYANSIHYHWQKPAYVDDFGCVVIDDANHYMGVVFTGISRGLLSAADLLVIVITWMKTSYVATRIEGSVGPSIAKALLRSGIIYFIPLFILNLLHTILTETGAEQFLRHSSVISIFIDPVTSVLACRFLMSLRSVEADRSSTASRADMQPKSTMRFTPGSETAATTASTQTLPPFISTLG